MHYSLEFKEAAIQKYLTRGSRTVKEILEDIGITSPTLYQWRDEFAKVGGMKKQSKFKDRKSSRIPAFSKFKNLIY